MTNRRLTPSEAIYYYPDLFSKMNWLPQDIGRLVRMKIIDGYSVSGGGCIVKEESLLEFIVYLNTRDNNTINIS